MKHYTIPTAILLILSGLMLLGILKSIHAAGAAAAELAAAQTSVRDAQVSLAAAQTAAAVAQAKSAPTDKFLAAWNPEIASEANIEEIFGQLDTLAVNNVLSPSGKSFAVKPNYYFNGRQFPVESVNITVAGDFFRTLNWLGAVENSCPLARVEQISYTNVGNSLSLAVQLVFPRKFDAP
jgi:hypothetical protein